MKVLDMRCLILAFVLGAGLGTWAAWKWQAARYGLQLSTQALTWQREREQAALAVVDWQNAEQAQRRALEVRLHTNDTTIHKELSDAQTAQARLRDRLATADLRLSVLLANSPPNRDGMPAGTDAGGVVHGGPRGELDPAAAERIVAITDYGDRGLIALKACQAYVREIAH
ncbi:lysozyme [Pseudomonas syringae pv. lapsa]|uniref:Bacteriophage host lysis protein n=1 Tax=Pseudomonas syringae pv. lapsa TaxID=199201 RepID=A0AB74AAI7_PSESX|nr:lysis system i-spanin subunit Rz [Pseudomonas syringae]ALU62551.1 lysozyme [Pseudomonas syringae pv. lapsa]KPX60968.1 Bacteriophage host lysis protein [Pseudomonas syringae pv. lapsa]RML28089.1 Bacteriophage host lysis protein [Pseudomonas syringae pv. lapsa]